MLCPMPQTVFSRGVAHFVEFLVFPVFLNIIVLSSCKSEDGKDTFIEKGPDVRHRNGTPFCTYMFEERELAKHFPVVITDVLFLCDIGICELAFFRCFL